MDGSRGHGRATIVSNRGPAQFVSGRKASGFFPRAVAGLVTALPDWSRIDHAVDASAMTSGTWW